MMVINLNHRVNFCMRLCACMCMCVRACACACMCMCVYIYVCVCDWVCLWAEPQATCDLCKDYGVRIKVKGQSHRPFVTSVIT